MGSFKSVLNSIILNTKYKYNGTLKLEFAKTLFQTWVIFLGLIFFSIPYLIKRYLNHDKQLIISKPKMELLKETALPSLCFITYSIMNNYSLTILAPSVSQIISGFQLLFTTLLSVSFRQRRLYLSEWTGLFINVFGMIFSGVTVLIHGKNSNDSELRKVFLAFIILIIGQGVKAFESILNERLLQDQMIPPSLLASLEGVWGLYICTFILMPFMNVLDPKNPLYENSIESFEMVFSSLDLSLTLLFYIISASFFTFSCLVIINTSSAINKNLYETMEPFFIWALSIFFKYVLNLEGNNVYIDIYSILEFLGCLFAAIGALVFNKVIKFGCFIYDEDEAKQALKGAHSESGTERIPSSLYNRFL